MRLKLTLGITLASTRTMIFCTSPAWIDLSALAASMTTSVEMRTRAHRAPLGSDRRCGQQQRRRGGARRVRGAAGERNVRRILDRGGAARASSAADAAAAAEAAGSAAATGAAAAGADAAGSAPVPGARMPPVRAPGLVARRLLRQRRRLAIVDQAAPALQVGVAGKLYRSSAIVSSIRVVSSSPARVLTAAATRSRTRPRLTSNRFIGEAEIVQRQRHRSRMVDGPSSGHIRNGPG